MAKKPTLKETIQLQQIANNNLSIANAELKQQLRNAADHNAFLTTQLNDADVNYSELATQLHDSEESLRDAQITIRGITAQHFIDLRNVKLANDARKVAWILFDVAFGFAIAYLIWS